MQTTMTLELEVIDNTHGNFVAIRAKGLVIGTIKHMLGCDNFRATFTGGQHNVTKDFGTREKAAEWIVGKAATNNLLAVAFTYTQGDHLGEASRA